MKLKINIDKEIKTGEDVLAAIIEFHNDVTGVLIEDKNKEVSGMTPQKYVATMMYISLHLCSIFVNATDEIKFKQFISGIIDNYFQTKEKIDNTASSSKLYN